MVANELLPESFLRSPQIETREVPLATPGRLAQAPASSGYQRLTMDNRLFTKGLFPPSHRPGRPAQGRPRIGNREPGA